MGAVKKLFLIVLCLAFFHVLNAKKTPFLRPISRIVSISWIWFTIKAIIPI